MRRARIFGANGDTTFLRLIKDLLEQEGYAVRVLKATQSAYEKVIEYLPDLLIIDITLKHPETGWLILDKIKLNPKTTGIPVIICSSRAYLFRQQRDYLKSMGCFILEKPFDKDDLFTMLVQAMGNSQAPSA